MKKILFIMVMLCGTLVMANAQKQAEIKFDVVKVDLGKFHENDGVQKCTFTFKNVGNAPLVINQAVASCGCTVPTYTKEPVAPGQSGKIDVTYNGKGKFPGSFKKTITVRTNGKTEMTRLYITGNMVTGDEKVTPSKPRVIATPD